MKKMEEFQQMGRGQGGARGMRIGR